KIPNCFPRTLAQEWLDQAFHRMHFNPHDRATWPKNPILRSEADWRVHDVRHSFTKVWDACCDLLGGPERIDEPYVWGSAFIINLPEAHTSPNTAWQPPSPNLPGWHKDGNFFRHFLDSPEQGLLVIALWSDISPL